MGFYACKMATSFQNKLNDLEARLKAENADRSKDPNPRDLNLGISASRRPKPRKTAVCRRACRFTIRTI